VRYTLATKSNVAATVDKNQYRRQSRLSPIYGRLCRRIGRLCGPNVEHPFDFVASVYEAKATRSTLSTFNKVDRVEFDFVASVYRALVTTSTISKFVFTSSVTDERIGRNHCAAAPSRLAKAKKGNILFDHSIVLA